MDTFSKDCEEQTLKRSGRVGVLLDFQSIEAWGLCRPSWIDIFARENHPKA